MTIPFCTLCGNINADDLGKVIGICLDKDACHKRQLKLARREAYEDGKADGAAAERDSIRQLAREVRASYQPCPCDPAKGIGVPNHGPVPFADLLAPSPDYRRRDCGAPACEI